MRTAVLAVMLGYATVALAEPEEDAAHRADRLRTAALNRRAAASITARTHRSDAQEAYRSARERYQRALAEWRARVAACEAGDYDACR